MSWVHKLIFGISTDEVLVSKRGFTVSEPDVQSRIEQIGSSFVTGYHAALLDNDLDSLCPNLDQQAKELRGFVYEGAAMGLAIVDFFAPWRVPRWQLLAKGSGYPYQYLLYVGAGWALARLPISMNRMLSGLHPQLSWLLLDGYGFHEGYFHAQRTIAQQRYPRRVHGYARCVFDQGIGRSLWFVLGADVSRIVETINAFTVERHAHLWSGVGLAAAYAGGVSDSVLQDLTDSASGAGFKPQLAQGVAFAAKARVHAGNLFDLTERACQVITGKNAAQLVDLVDAAQLDLPLDTPDLTAYEVWRQRIQAALA